MRAYIFRVIFWTAIIAILLSFFWRPALRVVFPNPYGHIVEEVTGPYDIDPLLVVAIMRAESHFRVDAVSPRGARGLMQLMPDTAQWAAEQIPLPDYTIDHIHRPETNITIGAWYINHLIDVFGGNVLLAVAAYNAGQGNVRRWHDEAIWDGTLATADTVPFAETRQYIQRVTDGYRLYRILHPSRHAGHQM